MSIARYNHNRFLHAVVKGVLLDQTTVENPPKRIKNVIKMLTTFLELSNYTTSFTMLISKSQIACYDHFFRGPKGPMLRKIA
jgi:hypothetical protein